MQTEATDRLRQGLQCLRSFFIFFVWWFIHSDTHLLAIVLQLREGCIRWEVAHVQSRMMDQEMDIRRVGSSPVI